MSKGAARLGDRCSGHGCFPPRNNVQGSPNVFINGRPAHRQGDMWAAHCCPKQGCHPSALSIGSPTVYTNGKQQGRKDDPVACGSRVVTCSGDVFVGSGSSGPPAQPASEIEQAALVDEPEIDMGVLVWPHPKGKPTPAQVQQSIANGHNPYNPPPAAKETDDTPPRPSKEAPVTCDGLKAPFVDNTQLTTHFQLGDFTTRTTAGKHIVVSQHGLSEAEIVCNLKRLAENVLEPIIAAGIKVEISSAFRTAQGRNESGNISQHEKGQAVDLKFPGCSKPQGYYDMAKKLRDMIPFDQLILEYNGPGSMWIHISYSQHLRKSVLTRLSQGNYQGGLILA